MSTSTPFDHVAITRGDQGIVEVRIHTGDGPMVWAPRVHDELVHAFSALADDPEVRVVLLTGTGDEFCTTMDAPAFLAEKYEWHQIWWYGKRILQRLADIDVPVIGVLNGRATIHAELLFLSDIIIAADTASVADHAHFPNGAVPGDGVHVIWPYLLGPQRGKYFLLTGQEIDAQELLRLGAVNEVVPADAALERGRELARSLAEKPTSTLRYTRALLIDPLRKQLHEQLSHGLGVEGAFSSIG
jgi:enoyl-CoA hydratase/carnithine racemase